MLKQTQKCLMVKGKICINSRNLWIWSSNKPNCGGGCVLVGSGPATGQPSSEEGALRGDKGVKEEAEVGQTSYLLRALSLARGEILLLSCAFFCLAVSSFSSLILPNYQVGCFSLFSVFFCNLGRQVCKCNRRIFARR